jgi:hypothetical protein
MNHAIERSHHPSLAKQQLPGELLQVFMQGIRLSDKPRFNGLQSPQGKFGGAGVVVAGNGVELAAEDAIHGGMVA